MSATHPGPCACRVDPRVAYDGPRALLATLGGSPTWGLGDRFHEVAARRGHVRLEDPTLTLDHLYMEVLPEVAATLELALLDRLTEPSDCRCRALLRPRPAAYARAFSPREDASPA